MYIANVINQLLFIAHNNVLSTFGRRGNGVTKKLTCPSQNIKNPGFETWASGSRGLSFNHGIIHCYHIQSAINI